MGIWAVFQANQREADTVCGQAVTFSRRRARCGDGQIDSRNSTDLWIFFSAAYAVLTQETTSTTGSEAAVEPDS